MWSSALATPAATLTQMIGPRAPGRGSLLLFALVGLNLAGLALPVRVRGAPAVVPECEGLKIAILDLNDLSEAAKVPRCSLNDVRPPPVIAEQHLNPHRVLLVSCNTDHLFVRA